MHRFTHFRYYTKRFTPFGNITKPKFSHSNDCTKPWFQLFKDYTKLRYIYSKSCSNPQLPFHTLSYFSSTIDITKAKRVLRLAEQRTEGGNSSWSVCIGWSLRLLRHGLQETSYQYQTEQIWFCSKEIGSVFSRSPLIFFFN
ncbi:hypothetical protein SLA2020_391820 [Shorea laevis]